MVALGFALSTPLVLLTPPALRMAPPTMQFAPHPDRFRGRAYVSGGDLVEPGPAGVTTSTGGGGALHEINEYYQRGNAAERRGYAEPPPGMYQEERPRRPARLAERMRTEQAQGQGGPSGMDMRPGSLSVDVAGYIPTNAHPDAVSAFGIFYDTGRMVNGKPAYVNAQQSDVMLYWSPKGDWIIGLKREIGTGATMTGFARSMDRGA